MFQPENFAQIPPQEDPMKKETIKYIRLIYGIVLGVMTVVAGICLIAACIGIYRSGGEQIYTAEKVTLAFSEISGPVYWCLAMIVLGFILDFALPNTDKKRKPEKNYAAILERLLAKRDLDTCADETKQAIGKERALRRRDSIVCLVLLAVCSAGFLIYGVNPANFHQSEINGSMVKAVAILFGCLAVPFGFSIFAAYRSKASLKREIELVKTIPAGEKKVSSSPAPAANRGLMVARCVVLSAAIVLVVYGFFAGGTADVLTKAINICTECVGLG